MKKRSLLPVFEKSNSVHLPTYYYLLLGAIPSIRNYYRIDIPMLLDKLIASYSLDERLIIKTQNYQHQIDRLKTTTATIQIDNSILLFVNATQQYVELYYSCKTNSDSIENVQSLILTCIKIVEKEKKVGLIVTDSSGDLEVREFNIAHQNDSIADLYNDDFLQFHTTITQKLEGEKSNGLILLHGSPGTGKSSYIRHLIGSVQKRFIYLPSALANHIGMPSFLHFLSHHSGSVLIIEDAEELLMKRRNDSKPAISNLLNLSDGLLSDCLKIQVIATFNCDYNKIDEAFLRKGRIIGRHCFEPLTVQKSNSLLAKLQFKYITETPMTLAEIFNWQDTDYRISNRRMPVGFNLNEPSL